MTASASLTTAGGLLRLPRGKQRHELVLGRLVTKPLRVMWDGAIASNLSFRIGEYVKSHDLGEVFAAGTGFHIHHNPDTVYGPALGFIARKRLSAEDVPVGYLEMAPDLVAEVVSPSDIAAEVQAKVEGWLEAGVKLVWVVYPETRSVAVYRSLEEVSVLRERDTLTGEPALPGFQCVVRELF
ncbi:MAG: Uma2 family endonuclease [Chloroflexi bacterium]|nr:Uma2 family endonuclease [Chloroflexota bacterium]